MRDSRSKADAGSELQNAFKAQNARLHRQLGCSLQSRYWQVLHKAPHKSSQNSTCHVNALGAALLLAPALLPPDIARAHKGFCP